MRDTFVLALCQTKGGSGKSTLAECFAIEAAKGHIVHLMELDPQASTTKWWRRRGGPLNPMLVTDVKSLTAYMVSMKKRGGPDVLIIDTPGSMLGAIRDAVEAAAAVVIPIAPSIKDWEAMDVVESIVKGKGKQDKTLYLLNRFRKGTDASEEALRALTERASNPPLTIELRTAYEKADLTGLTGPEINKDAAKEIANAWSRIKEIGGYDQSQAVVSAAEG